MKRLISAFFNSVAAFRHLAKHEAAFRQECVVFALAMPLAYFVAKSVSQFFLLLGVLVFVIIVEVLNTAIEEVCDALTTEFNPRIKVAKDAGSLAVLLSIAIAAVTWGLAVFI